jgi:hypothetical protein
VFFGDNDRTSNLFIKPVYLDRFDSVLRGRAFDDIISITVPTEAIKNSKKLKNVFLVLMHELCHIFVKNNKEIKKEINRFGSVTGMTEYFYNQKKDFDSFAEEILIRMFVPKGYFFDNTSKMDKNIDNLRGLKEFKNKQIDFNKYEQISFDKMHNDIESYISKGKQIDSEFIKKFLSVFKK